MTAPLIRVMQALHRSRGMVARDIEWALTRTLEPTERDLLQRMHKATIEEAAALRTFLEEHSALHEVVLRRKG